MTAPPIPLAGERPALAEMVRALAGAIERERGQLARLAGGDGREGRGLAQAIAERRHDLDLLEAARCHLAALAPRAGEAGALIVSPPETAYAYPSEPAPGAAGA